MSKLLLSAQLLLAGYLGCVGVASAATVTHSGTISASTVWSGADVHRITGTVTVNSGVQLTIEPGAVVKFNSGTALNVDGVLIAAGNASEKIIFTSYRDDSIGGNTNGGADNEIGQPGDWARLYFSNSVIDSLTVMDYVEVRYGGGSTAGIYQNSASVDITNSVIRDNANQGIYLRYSYPRVENNVIRDNATSGIYLSNGSGQPRLLNNQLIDNGNHGIYSRNDMVPRIEGNTITGSSSWGVYFYSAYNAPPMQDNTITGNGYPIIVSSYSLPSASDNNVLVPNRRNVIGIRGNTRNTDLQLSVLNGGGESLSVYHLYSGNWTQTNSTTLTLDPGVKLKVSGNLRLEIQGILTAVGTVADRIVLTTLQDDSAGGDTNGNGSSDYPTNGSWQGIYFNNGPDNASVLDYVDLRYAGNSSSPGSAALYSNNVDLSISNSVISQSNTNYGIHALRSTLTITDTELYGHNRAFYGRNDSAVNVTGGRVYANAIDGFYFSGNANATLSGVEIFGNVNSGVNNAGTQTVIAEENWWGSADGPGGIGPGTGDRVLGNVDYEVLVGDSWLSDGSEFNYFNAGPNTSAGTLPAPAVVAGTSTTEWGTAANRSALYDLDQVSLSFSGLATDQRYDLFVTYYNADDTSSIGGNVQHLSTAAGDLANSQRGASGSHRFVLPLETYSTGDLDINVVLDNGYRAVLQQLWLIERATVDDVAPLVAITQPLGGEHLSGSSFTVEGTATDNTAVSVVEVGIDGGGGISWRPVSMLSNDGSWSYLWSLPGDGVYTLHARATDGAGNSNPLGAGVTITVNNEAAAAVTGLVASDAVGDSGSNIDLLWTLSADDGAGANDVESYRIERRIVGESDFINVGSTAAGNNSFVDSGTVDGVQYQYRVITRDLGGNESSSAIYGPAVSLDNLGGGDTQAPEDVTNLLTTVGNESVALRWTGSADSQLDLVDQLLDISRDSGTTWGSNAPDFDNGAAISLGKTASSSLQTGLINGQGYRFRLRVQDSTGNVSVGVQTGDLVPSATASTTVSGTIASDTVWETGVYYVTGNVTINAGATLTINPGVIVKLGSNVGITVNGDLVAAGAAGNEIIFTSYRDDSVGGNTNGGAADESGVAGDWYRLLFNSGVNATVSRLAHVDIRYGGSSSASVYINNNVSLPVSDSSIRFSGAYGLHVRGTSPISGNTIEDNVNAGIYSYNNASVFSDNTLRRNQHGLYVDFGNPTVRDNTLQDNDGYGLYDRRSTITQVPTGNTISGNNIAMRVTFAALPGLDDGNVISGNTRDQIEFYGNALSRSLELPSNVVYYQVSGTATINTGINVQLEPGLVWKFASGAMLTVNGALGAFGEAGNKIYFTSYRDDSVGGNTNGGADNEIGQPGDWGRLYYSNSVIEFLTALDYVEVRYGGSSTAGIYQSSASVDITNSVIRDNANQGIYLQYSYPRVENNVIRDNATSGIYLSNGSGQPRLLNNQLIDNGSYGIYSRNDMVPRIEGNTITGSSSWGVYFYSGYNAPPMQDNTITGNGYPIIVSSYSLPSASDNNVLVPNRRNVIGIRGNTRNTDLQLSVLNGGGESLSVYHLYSGNWTQTNSTTLTLDPGVKLKVSGNLRLEIQGILTAVGTVADRIVLTTLQDDSAGGDTNGNGSSDYPTNGSWQGIYFNNGPDNASVLDYVDLRYAGNSSSPGSAALYSNNVDLSISNSVISQSNTNYGIHALRSTLTITDTELYGHNRAFYGRNDSAVNVTGGRVYANAIDGFYFSSNANATLSGVEIFGNVNSGVNNAGTQTVIAEENWWGSADGPGGIGPGTGDRVLGNVDYEVLIGDSWLSDGSEFNYFNAGPNTSAGTLPAPAVVAGTSTTEWGTAANRSALYDLDQVSLSFSGLATDQRYDLFVTYYNADDTSSIGGNVQHLSTAAGDLANSQRGASGSHRFVLPLETYSTGDLDINVVLDNGYRAVLQQLWLIERATVDDVAPLVAITQPLGGEHLSGSSFTVEGTATDNTAVSVVEVGIDGGGGISWRPVSMLSNDGSWSYLWSLPGDGVYTLHARATDGAGNSNPLGAGVTITVNNEAAAAVTGLVASDAVGDSGSNIDLLWTLSADDGAGANDVESYRIERRIVGESDFINVGSTAAGNNSFVDSGTVDGVQYQYRVITRDLGGNESSSAIYGPAVSLDNLGGGDTQAPEDVTNLLTTVGNESVALRWTGSADSQLDLVDQLLDISRDSGTTWGSNAPDFDNGAAISLGKTASSSLQTGLINGQGYRFRLRVQDSTGNVSVGVQTGDLVPSATASTTVSGTIASDTVWETGVYYVTGNVTINAGATLTINPGVIVKLGSNVGITVNGDLVAAGAAGNEIIFTSYRDDSVGGNTNGGAADESGVAGDWYRLLFNSGVNATVSRLAHVDIRYGGSSSASVYINNNVSLPVSDSSIRFSGAYGLHVRGTSPISGNTIEDNVNAGIYSYNNASVFSDNTLRRNQHGLYVDFGNPTVRDNTLQDNDGYGLYDRRSTITQVPTGNTISGNNIAMRVTFAALPGLDDGNVISGNTRDQIEFYGNALSRSLELPSNVVYYQVSGTATINTGINVQLEPGLVWKFASGAMLTVNGALGAFGEAGNKIYFTSYRDDSVGGNTNGGADNEIGQPGDWGRLYYSNSVIEFLTALDYVEVRYGGSSTAGIYQSSASVDITNSVIRDNANQGIYLQYSYPRVENNVIRDNATSGIYLSNGSGQPRLLNNQLIDNGSYGIYSRNDMVPRIEGNTITGSSSWGVYFYSGYNAPPMQDNTITGNGYPIIVSSYSLPSASDNNVLVPNRRNVIGIRGNTRNTDLQLSVLNGGGESLSVYHLYSGNWTQTNSTTLTLDPGVKLKVSGNLRLEIQGILTAVGTVADRIVLTTLQDDSAGGDTNGNGSSDYPTNGSWQGIYFNNGPDNASVLDYVDLRYAGNSSSPGSAALYSNNVDLSISNSVISQSNTNYGIHALRSTLTITDTELYGHNRAFYGRNDSAVNVTGGRVYANAIDGFYFSSNANATLSGVEIFGNVNSGVNNAGTQTVIAEENWWGSADGPGGIGPGTGDRVLGNVDYEVLIGDSWLSDGSAYSYYNAGGTNHRAYALSIANVSGLPGTDWGSGAYQSFSYETEANVPLTADFAGLTPSGNYRLIVSYWNQDSGSSRQSMVDVDGSVIHSNLTLPTGHATQFIYRLAKSSFDAGSLSLAINRTSGLRTVVTGLFLIEDGGADSTAPVITIDAPAEADVIPLGSYRVTGNVSDSAGNIERVEIGIGTGSSLFWQSVTGLSADGSWYYNWAVNNAGSYRVQARAIDTNGNQTLSDLVNVSVDTSPPRPAVGVSLQSLPGGIRVLWTLSADDGAGADDVQRYEIWRRSSIQDPLVYIGEVVNGVGLYDDTSVLVGNSYLYVVRTVDRAGYKVDSIEAGPIVSSADPDVTPPEDVSNLNAQVTHLGGSASAYLTWDGSANSAGDLANQKLYVSADDGASFGSNAPDFDNGQAIVLSKLVRQYIVGGLAIGETYQIRITTLDGVPNESAGVSVNVSPTGAATEYVSLSGNLPTDTTFEPGVYVINASLTVPAGVTLTLAPGTIVKFANNQSLTVDGDLIAQGSDGNPVIFTALSDDSFGGDTNNDGPSTGAPGYWRRIQFNSTADASLSMLDHVTVRYAGAGGNGNVYLSTSSVPVTNSLLQLGSSHGIYSYNGSAKIQGNSIEDNALDGINVRFGSPTFSGNSIQRNQHGIYTRDAPVGAVQDNTIIDNSGYGIYFYNTQNTNTLTGNTIQNNNIAFRLPASALPDASNTIENHNQPYVYVLANTLTSDLHLPIWDAGQPDAIDTYIVQSGWITVPTFNIMTIDPGAVLKFQAAGIRVDGRLIAQGQDAAPIYFTSYRDATVGADPDGDASELAQPSDWYGIAFNDSLFETQNLLERTIVRFGGSQNSSNIYTNGANITIKNSEISQSNSYGIWIFNASPDVTGNRIWGNNNDGILIDQAGSNPLISFNEISTNGRYGIYVYRNSSATLGNNQFFRNRSYGVYNGTANLVDASNSWWGDVDGSGPYHSTTNVSGTGDRVGDNVTYTPFLTDVQVDYSYRNFSTSTPDTVGSLGELVLDQGTLSNEWGIAANQSMAFDANLVEISTSGLDPATRYKLRVSYYNGDPAAVYQSLTDGDDNPIHASLLMPTGSPVMYEFPIPQAYFSDGTLTLRSYHDNPGTSIRGAVTESWIIEDIEAVTPPLFSSIEYNDVDGSGNLSIGDIYRFHFSEPLDSALIAGATDANDKLVPDGGAIYGTTNTVSWSADLKSVDVTLTTGFTVIGGENVTPVGLADTLGNAVIGIQSLPISDTISPRFIGLTWQDADADEAVSLGDSYTFLFDETMDTSVLVDGTTAANAHLRPQGGRRYGISNSITWALDSRSVTVEITPGFTVVGDELVIPGSFITDVAGNPVTGTQYLLGKDSEAPVIDAVEFDDADGSGSVTLGDRYRFSFSEPMRISALSDQTAEANLNLVPAGGKRWGSINSISWNGDNTKVTIEITSGYTVAGNETVTASALVTDLAGNPISNSIDLNLNDTVAANVVSMVSNYISPTSATDTYRLTVQFDSRMNPAVLPQVSLSSSGSQQPVVPTGEWLTTFYPNDTYTTGDIVLIQGMDGLLSGSVSGAEDWAGNVMAPAIDIFSAELDATPPANPVVSVIDQSCDSATLGWAGYSAPVDLTGFQIYRRTDGPFTLVDGTSFIQLVSPASSSVVVGGLNFEIPYELAVVAMDDVGNITPTVSSHSVFIPQVIPAAVSIDVGAGANSDQAVVDWTGYDSSESCGFAGFNVYLETGNFTSVDGLTPVTTLAANEFTYTFDGLDRGQTYYIAVVGVNVGGQYLADVTSVEWRDPYAGDVTTDTVIGSGDEKTVDINESITVSGNATVTVARGTELRFAAGTGIFIQQGTLNLEGTVFEPVVLTSINAESGSALPGDWSGILLGPNASGSVLRHVVLEYGQGLTLDGSDATLEAFTARYNSGAGLRLRNNASLVSSEALLRFNDIGVSVESSSLLTLDSSVIKNNAINAQSDGSVTPVLQANWWGSLDPATILAGISGNVDSSNFLTYEPVLSPAIGTADGELQVITPNVTLWLPGRNAEEIRISEDATFEDVFFDPWQEKPDFVLSPNGGEKIIYAQFRSITGTNSETVSVTLNYVTEGPVISNLSLSDGQVIRRPIKVTAEASALLGLAQIEVLLDGVLLTSTTDSSLDFDWDPRSLSNDTYSMVIRATDLGGHVTQISRTLVVDLVAADAPVITSPVNNSIVSSEPVSVQGSAEPGILVRVRRDGTIVGTPTADPITGSFFVPNVSLSEGSSNITAIAVDSVGISAQSQAVTITLDTGAPAPVVLSGEARSGEPGIDLGWNNAAIGESAVAFHVYRATSPFTDKAQAQLISTSPVTDQIFEDTPPADGTYYYAIVGEDSAGNLSDLSNLLAIIYDRQNPQLGIAYDKVSPVGPGTLNITVTSSEELQQVPSLALTPANGGVPQAVILSALDATTFSGSLEITAAMNSGQVSVNAVATDQFGNKGSGAPAGDSLVLDTRGPSGSILVNPAAPVQVQAATDINVSVTLDEAMKPGSLPALQLTLPAGGSVTIPLIGSATSWSGVVNVDSSAGDGFGSFALTTEDALGNIGNTITSGGTIELYTTALPVPAAVPDGLVADAQPGGQVSLSWNAAENAGSYRLYRRAGDCSVAPSAVLLDNLATLSVDDLPATDGDYCYAVSSLRQGAESELSELVEVTSDRVPPAPADNLVVSLQNNGVDIDWDAPAGEVASEYELTRNGLPLRVLAGGQPNYSVQDFPDAGGSYEYVVVAIDAAGNSSSTAPVNLALIVGAVSNLEVIVMHDEAPSLAWTNNDPNVVGFEVYFGANKLHPGLLTEASFQDTSYAGLNAVTYGVRAVDGLGQRSPARYVTVYPVELNARANVDAEGNEQGLLTNNFSRFSVSVDNLGAATAITIDDFSLQMTVDAVAQFDETFTLDETIVAQGQWVRDVVIPIGNTDRDHLLLLTATQADPSGNRVSYQRPVLFSDVTFAEDIVSLSLDDVPLSGGISSVRLCVTNQGYTPMEIVAATDQGRAPGDIYVSILDEQGLEIARGQYQGTPSGSQLRGGDLIVQLMPDQEFCVNIQVLVPAGLAAGTRLSFVGSLNRIQLLDNNQTLVAGDGGLINKIMVSGITQSPYYGVAQADQALYSDDDTVTVTGQAINRQSGLPEANVPIKIGFQTRGYKWFESLVTDGAGNFSFEYQPIIGLSGQFQVWAAHPDVFDTLDQDSFSFYRVFAKPARADIRSSKADTLDFQIELLNPGEEVLDNLSLSFRAYTIDALGVEVDEPRLQGSLNTAADWSVAPGKTKKIQLQLSADIDAPTNANVEYTLSTGQGASTTFVGVVTLSEAIPLLDITSPRVGYVDTSMNVGATRTVPVTVKNEGLRDLEDAVLTLPDTVTWISTTIAEPGSNQVQLGTIPVGESITFDVLITPPLNTSYGYHEDSFVISGSNAQQDFIVNVYALVTSSATGSVQFNVFNIVGQDVPNARIRMWNNVLEQEVYGPNTDASGVSLVEDLKLGDWNWQVVSSGHQSATGTVTVEADQIVQEDVELFKNLVTISFNVVPVPYTDKYTIIIEQKFDTHVPIPVLIVDPTMTTFYNPDVGFEAIVPVEVTNFGLKAATDFTVVGSSAAWGSWQPLITYMPQIGAMETVTIPFRFTYYGLDAAGPPEGPSDYIPWGCNEGGGLSLSIDDLANGLWALMSAGYRSIYANVPRTTGANTGLNVELTPCTVGLSDNEGNEITSPSWCPEPVEEAWNIGQKIGSWLACLGGGTITGDGGDGGTGGTRPSSGGSPGAGGPGCFVEGTPIQLADGSIKRIEDVVMGDQVLGFDGSAAGVTRVYTRETDHIRELRYRDVISAQLHRVETTDEHLYWVQNKSSWVRAGKLQVGDILALAGNQLARIESSKRRAADMVVYNFDVEGLHSYYANDALVYQQCGAEPDSAVTQKLLNTQSISWRENDWDSLKGLLTQPLAGVQ